MTRTGRPRPGTGSGSGTAPPRRRAPPRAPSAAGSQAVRSRRPPSRPRRLAHHHGQAGRPPAADRAKARFTARRAARGTSTASGSSGRPAGPAPAPAPAQLHHGRASQGRPGSRGRRQVTPASPAGTPRVTRKARAGRRVGQAARQDGGEHGQPGHTPPPAGPRLACGHRGQDDGEARNHPPAPPALGWTASPTARIAPALTRTIQLGPRPPRPTRPAGAPARPRPTARARRPGWPGPSPRAGRGTPPPAARPAQGGLGSTGRADRATAPAAGVAGIAVRPATGALQPSPPPPRSGWRPVPYHPDGARRGTEYFPDLAREKRGAPSGQRSPAEVRVGAARVGRASSSLSWSRSAGTAGLPSIPTSSGVPRGPDRRWSPRGPGPGQVSDESQPLAPPPHLLIPRRTNPPSLPPRPPPHLPLIRLQAYGNNCKGSPPSGSPARPGFRLRRESSYPT